MYGAVGRTSVLVFTMPFWTLVFARIALGERLHGSQWGAVALAAAGLVVIVDPSHPGGSLLSALLATTGGALWGAGAVLTKRLDVAHRTDPLSFTAWQLLFGTVPLVLLAMLVPARPVDWTPEFAAALTFSGAISTGLGWLLWTWVLKRLPAGTAGLTTLAIPVIAVLGAWLQLGERPAAREIVGMVTIGAALAWVSAASPRRTGETLDDAVPE
jgi:drug/metabolite transporter (DMT)-like permease